MKEFGTREEMIDALVPKHGTYAEIGVFEGEFAERLVDILRPTKLVLVDMFEGTMGSGDQDGNNFHFVDLGDCYRRLKSMERPSFLVRKGYSYEYIPTFEDDAYDMIYVDADHSYEGILRDLKLSYDKVRNGGWLMGHDYAINPLKTTNSYDFGVKRAVEDFCREYNQEIFALALDGCVSFAICINKLGLNKEDARVV